VSPTPLAATTRYIHAGQTAIYWVQTIATIAWPTRPEIDAGIDLTRQVAAVIGWRASRRTRPVLVYGVDFEAQLEGLRYVDDSRLVFYGHRTGPGVVQTIPEGSVGHIVMVYGGDAAGHPMDVWPVRVAGYGRGIELNEEPARVDAQYVIFKAPALDLLAPAVA
jgi:hypothetical protein